MKLTLLSDLHLEFSRLEQVPLTDADVLLLAGDIFVLNSLNNPIHLDRLTRFLETVAEHYPNIIAIAGNHEYYGSDITSADEEIRKIYQSYGIDFLQNETRIINDVTFVGTTLWTRVKPDRVMQVHAFMNDYLLILKEDVTLTVNDTNDLNMKMLDWLTDTINSTVDPLVVVTHTAPSYASISDYYLQPQNSLLNSAFANELADFIMNNEHIRLWCHGHVHNNNDYFINKTRVISNPRGYPTEHQYNEWDTYNLINI